LGESRYGFQLTIGARSIIDTCRCLYSPSICLRQDVTLGMIHSNQLEDDNVPLRSAFAFPAATMPPLPLAPAPANSGPDVTVAVGEVRALLPGSYGSVTIFGTLLLNHGTYSFASAVLTDCARLIAITGEVQICIRDFFTAGRRVRVYPAFHKSADQLTLTVSGLDTGARPVVSIGAASGAFVLVMRSDEETGILSDVVSAHLRSLEPDHLTDVLSTDRHTIKPWFNGRLDVAPPVVDLSAQGFALIGGRLDAIGGKMVAVIVYRRRAQIINLFAAPAPTNRRPATTRTVSGFNIRRWLIEGVSLWAISDINAAELEEFSHKFEAAIQKET